MTLAITYHIEFQACTSVIVVNIPQLTTPDPRSIETEIAIVGKLPRTSRRLRLRLTLVNAQWSRDQFWSVWKENELDFIHIQPEVVPKNQLGLHPIF